MSVYVASVNPGDTIEFVSKTSDGDACTKIYFGGNDWVNVIDTFTSGPVTSPASYTVKANAPAGTYSWVTYYNDNNGGSGVEFNIEVLAAQDVTAPVISGSTTVSVTEPSTAVASFTADEAVSSWSLGGTDASLFSIDSSGVVTFAAASVAGTYNFDVEATDAGGNTGTLAVTVNVTAAADTTAPVVSGSAAVSVSAPSTTVASFTADEAVSTWSLGGTDAGLFSIDSSGVVTFAAASVAGTYSIDVEATDAAGNKGTFAVTVTVAADATAPVVSGTAAITVLQPSTAVGTFTADEAVSTWSLGGTDAGLFNIDSSGVVTFAAASVAGTYSIDVEATDAAGNKGTFAVTVTVTDDATAPVITGSRFVTVTPPSTTVATYSANETIASWTLSGADDYRFKIVNGVVSFKWSAVPGAYGLVVEATDAAGNKGTLSVTVTVKEVVKTKLVKKLTVPSFAAGSSMLTTGMKNAIKSVVASTKSANSFTCTGYATSSPRLKTDAALAKARAKSVCDYIKTLKPAASVKVVGMVPSGLANVAKNRKVVIDAYSVVK
jgi:outer membrane protein OmpA-like peptidoglycan-associated protein